jgi:hypothetical protein
MLDQTFELKALGALVALFLAGKVLRAKYAQGLVYLFLLDLLAIDCLEMLYQGPGEHGKYSLCQDTDDKHIKPISAVCPRS